LADPVSKRTVEDDPANGYFLGPDCGRRMGEKRPLKVFLRTLLFSTSKRGQTVESLHVKLQRGESRQSFSIWVYGDGPLAHIEMKALDPMDELLGEIPSLIDSKMG
jgi:hypothetical protein